MQPLILAVETSSRVGSVAIALGEKLLAETKFAGPTRHSEELFPSVCALLDRFSRKPDQIEHIYISVGPGSFTGLRIAVTMAKTMSLANAAKIVAVDSLDIIAANVIDLTPQTTIHERQATSNEKIATILDAKRNQFFIAVYEKKPEGHKCTSAQDNEQKYDIRYTQYAIRSTSNEQQATSNGIWKKILPDSLMTSDEFLNKFACPDQPIWLLGDGLLYYRDKFKADDTRFFDEQYWSPRAKKVHLLGYQKALAGQFANPLTLQPNYLRAPDTILK
jgi:tRNA threonylcarbamoyl adenosine modification protein YeaZ